MDRDLARHGRQPLTLLLLALAVLGVSGRYAPAGPLSWGLEVLPAIIGIFVLLFTFTRFPMSHLVYGFVFVHILILNYGGFYTYAETPLGNWAREAFGLSRNPYDRVGHLAVGLFPSFVVREVLLRRTPLKRGGWLYFLILAVILAIAAFWELLEWWVCLAVAPGTGDAFLATQGDIWDAQWDMLLALVAAALIVPLLGKRHDRSMARAIALERRNQRAAAGGSIETLSIEADSFLALTTPDELPSPLTPAFAAAFRARRTENREKFLRRLQATHLRSAAEDMIAGVPVQRLTPKGAAEDGRVLLYLHGGGFVFGNALDATGISLTQELGLPAVCPSYRLAPEHPFPAGFDDCFRVYQALLHQVEARKVVAVGSSAGGNLLVALLLRAQDEGLAMPGAIALLTPWMDLARTGDSLEFNDGPGRDVVLTWERQLSSAVQAYAGTRSLQDPLLSPLYGRFHETFPPTFISTGTRDLFLSYCVRFHQRLKDAGVTTELAVTDGMWHGFQGMPDLPEAQATRRHITRFLLRHSIA
jgi:acetyl esterase/lipase/uncharacterized membrane protein YjdF